VVQEVLAQLDGFCMGETCSCCCLKHLWQGCLRVLLSCKQLEAEVVQALMLRTLFK
jgi:hypothetical protein